MEFPR